MEEQMDAFESFLNLPPGVMLLIIALPLAALMAGAFYLSRNRGRDLQSADFGKEALAIIAGGFVFVGAFAIVTSWNLQSSIATHVTNEFAAATSLAEDMGDVKSPEAQALAQQLVTYAESVKAAELGFSGVVGPSRDAQAQLATIQDSVVSIVSTTALTTYQIDNIYSHLEELKDARKVRLAVTLPNLPIELISLIVISAALSLVGVSLYPPSDLKWVKYFYAISSLAVVSGLILTILVLQSPRYTATQVSHQLDMFMSSVTGGGANIDKDQPSMGDAPAPGEGPQPGPPDGSGNPAPGQP
ncbi:MAG: hypothetical protein K9H50_00125 [Aurantimicrobium sp.]|nr:hypothetical protein [Aurantimicrobium sp.]